MIPLATAPVALLKRHLLFRGHALSEVRQKGSEYRRENAQPERWPLGHEKAASAEPEKQDDDGGNL